MKAFNTPSPANDGDSANTNPNRNGLSNYFYPG